MNMVIGTGWRGLMPDLAGRPPLGQKTGHGKKDPTRLEAVTQCACVICGFWPVEVHHCISGRYSQRKAPDSMTIPLCYACHRGQHGIHANKAAWEGRYGLDTSYLPLVDAMLKSR